MKKMSLLQTEGLSDGEIFESLQHQGFIGFVRNKDLL